MIFDNATIIAGPNSLAIENLITNLVITEDGQRHDFRLRDEGEAGAFLGICIEKSIPKKFTLTQTSSIDNVLKEASLEQYTTSQTPCSVVALGKDANGESFHEYWEYTTLVDMIIYVSTNSRPDIAYAVNQCTLFTHCDKTSHAISIKHILCYLKRTIDKDACINPIGLYNANYFVDADFAGLWNSEDDQDPVFVKSRIGFIIM